MALPEGWQALLSVDAAAGLQQTPVLALRMPRGHLLDLQLHQRTPSKQRHVSYAIIQKNINSSSLS